MNNPPRILIVDDEPSVLIGLTLAFEETGWQIEAVTSATVALERFRNHPFDLVLSDKNLPDFDGVTLLRQLREENDQVRLIMITGYGSVGSAIETTNLGIDAYLEKPFRDIFAVTRIVREALERNRSPSAGRISQFLSRKTGAVSAIPTGTPPSSPDPMKASPLQVLIAAADLRTRKIIADRVAYAGGETLFATTSREIFETLAEKPPDAIVVCGALDMVELVGKIRGRAPAAALVVASDSLDLHSVKQLIDLRVTAIIDAAADSDEFGKRIDKLLRGIRVARRS